VTLGTCTVPTHPIQIARICPASPRFSISYFAVEHEMGFAVPMLIGTLAGAASVIIAVLISLETKGKVFVSDLMKH
jgi:hypothetical protein